MEERYTPLLSSVEQATYVRFLRLLLQVYEAVSSLATLKTPRRSLAFGSLSYFPSH